jgi:hypothetical protein
MALTLNIENFSRNNLGERAKVARDAAKGISTFIIDNAQGITPDSFILLGAIGGSMSRIYQVQAVDGENITLTEGLHAPLSRGTEITRLFGNKIKVYSAPFLPGVIPQTSDFTPLPDGLIDLDPDQLSTEYTDQNGSELFWYRYTYRNSVTDGETPLSDSQAVRDNRTANYATLEDIRGEAGFDGNSYITDFMVDRKRQAAQAEINGALTGKYVVPFVQPVSPIVSDLTIRLAAGLLMLDEFGKYDSSDKSRAEAKLKMAREDLKMYQTGERAIIDAQGIDTTKNDGGGFSSGFSADSPQMFTKSLVDRTGPDRY